MGESLWVRVGVRRACVAVFSSSVYDMRLHAPRAHRIPRLSQQCNWLFIWTRLHIMAQGPKL